MKTELAAQVAEKRKIKAEEQKMEDDYAKLQRKLIEEDEQNERMKKHKHKEQVHHEAQNRKMMIEAL